MLFAIGLMITYEVVMRKVFNSPTIWVDETSRFCLIWAIYLASAHILKRRELITVELFTVSMSAKKRRFFELFALCVIVFFSGVAAYNGGQMVIESIEMGRRTSSMLGVPKWITESAIPAGFGLLFIQAVVEIVKLLRGDELTGPAEHKI